jgi:hypothetical protein
MAVVMAGSHRALRIMRYNDVKEHQSHDGSNPPILQGFSIMPFESILSASAKQSQDDFSIARAYECAKMAQEV